jgi:hypothetical protein
MFLLGNLSLPSPNHELSTSCLLDSSNTLMFVGAITIPSSLHSD